MPGIIIEKAEKRGELRAESQELKDRKGDADGLV